MFINFGYVRVSTREQNTDRQLIALKENGVPIENILTDKMSGKDFNRPAYRRLLKRLHKGDVLIIKSIDRLGRNYKDIIKQWQYITKEIGADIKVIEMPLLDTSQHKDLLGTFVADMVLQILSYVSEKPSHTP
ncbi:MAG: recombinase family protein [Firmicutes bacterium]|nr:recombinase family protein [Bacillota bacterium]